MTVEEHEIPVFIVTGTNWTMTVPLDEYNAQFPIERQRYEAATRALENIHKKRDDCMLVLNPDSRDENKAQYGVLLKVHVRGEKPETAVLVETHHCLADAGLYRQSIKMQKTFETKFAAKIEQIEAAEAARQKALNDQNILKTLADDAKPKE